MFQACVQQQQPGCGERWGVSGWIGAALVLATGGAGECRRRPLFTSGHELPATIHRVSSDIGCMVLLALAVSHCTA
ncbi:hypothetical protein BUALT_Bualt02G0151200 [Buddleja alternifolia]|uniref:Uncharacterized protein n=1 Tax=Buddleja alternifolia TaxID=168488 RepID=A0AAV6Y0E7_9LAMI|nr:hypothetical protein BUALT_Bualt02G0151200 [Buddleja alternifolia]